MREGAQERFHQTLGISNGPFTCMYVQTIVPFGVLLKVADNQILDAVLHDVHVHSSTVFA